MKFFKVSALVVGVLVAAVLMLTLLSIRGLPAARGGLPVAAQNGDVNCDGKVNLVDAVYLLQYIFKGGDAPCAIAQDACCPELVDQIKAVRDSLAPKLENRVSISIFNGSKSKPFYTVPAGKTLVVTDINGSNFVITDAVLERIPSSANSFHSQTGVLFTPGTELFVGVTPGVPYSGGMLTGYLIDS